MKARHAFPTLLTCAFLAASCVPIHVDRERYQPTQVVQGYAPLSVKELAALNERQLRGHLPDAVGGRIADPDIEPTRLLAPGQRKVEGPDQEDTHTRRLLEPDDLLTRHTKREVTWEARAPLSFAEERKFFRNGTGLPRYCVALSGGGIRSAAFGMGVLSALHRSGDLAKTDILSAVSGGAYTLSWYYAQHMHRLEGPSEDVDKELFDPDGQYQKFLAENASVFNTPGYAAVTAANVAAIPLNLLANGLFGWHLNTTPARAVYEYRLRSIFHREPEGRLRTFSFHKIGRMLGHEPDLAPEPEQTDDGGKDDATIARKALPKRLPYFIINATAFIEATADYHSAPLRNSVYEFTPLMFGSDAYGRFRYDPGSPTWPMSFGRAVSVSGAALDGTAVVAGNTQRSLWSTLNLDLGFYMNNPALHPSVIPQHRILPFPLYFLHHYPRDVKGTDIYLSDGGHSENLGAYSLVRRLCERIVIVDGEHDPTYEFEAYFNLKSGLKRDMGVVLDVPAIEKLGATELRELRRDRAARADPDLRRYLATRPGADGSAPADPFIDPIEGKRWNAVAAQPVMEGSVACLPHPDRRESSALSVQYVKLAYRPAEDECRTTDRIFKECAQDSIPRDLCWRDRIVAGKADRDANIALHYYCESRKTREARMEAGFLGPAGIFPQQPTTDQNFSEWQFRAYRDLGRKHMEAALGKPAARVVPDCRRD